MRTKLESRLKQRWLTVGDKTKGNSPAVGAGMRPFLPEVHPSHLLGWASFFVLAQTNLIAYRL